MLDQRKQLCPLSFLLALGRAFSLEPTSAAYFCYGCCLIDFEIVFVTLPRLTFTSCPQAVLILPHTPLEQLNWKHSQFLGALYYLMCFWLVTVCTWLTLSKWFPLNDFSHVYDGTDLSDVSPVFSSLLHSSPVVKYLRYPPLNIFDKSKYLSKTAHAFSLCLQHMVCHPHNCTSSSSPPTVVPMFVSQNSYARILAPRGQYQKVGNFGR